MHGSETAEKAQPPIEGKRPQFEVADILARYLPDYLSKRKLSSQQSKAVQAILDCRPQSMGAHVYSCSECGYSE